MVNRLFICCILFAIVLHLVTSQTYEPTVEPTSADTLISSSIDTGICPDYYVDFNLVTGETCTDCNICGDGTTCTVCPDKYILDNPQGICPDYLDTKNVTISGDTCSGCDICGGGEVCGVCTDYYSLIGTSQEPTVEPTMQPSVPTVSPSAEPTMNNTNTITGVCPDFTMEGESITGETCTSCDLCGDGKSIIFIFTVRCDYMITFSFFREYMSCLS